MIVISGYELSNVVSTNLMVLRLLAIWTILVFEDFKHRNAALKRWVFKIVRLIAFMMYLSHRISKISKTIKLLAEYCNLATSKLKC